MDNTKITTKAQLKDWISYELAKYGYRGGGNFALFREVYLV